MPRQSKPVRSVLECSERCASLPEWFATTLEALDRELGFRQSSVLLVLSGDPRSIHRAFVGATRGSGPAVLTEYFARWADSDPLATEQALEMFDRDGYATTAALYSGLEPAQRRFVDQFLASAGVRDQLSFRLPGNDTTDGYLTVHEPAVISAAQRRKLAPLVPGLAGRLRTMLPIGLPAVLSPREREAVELVAFGLTNEEIASVLNVRADTVKKHLHRAMRKLGIRRRSALAVAWATGRRLPDALARPGGPAQPSPS